jgi:hypothetical protein
MNLTAIIDLVREQDYFNCGETVEIAKGYNWLTSSPKEVYKKLVRVIKNKK